MRHSNLLSFAKRHPLALIAMVHIALSIYTSLSVPLWESYDEPGHIFYARHIGQTGTLPPVGSRLSDYDESHQPPLYYLLPAIPFALIDTTDNVRPQYTASGRTWAVFQPEVEAWPWTGTVLAIRIARFLSILPGTLCVILTWRTARVLFPKQKLIALVAAFAHAVWPMLVFMNGIVSNDTGMALMGSLVVWQIAELVRRPSQWRWWFGLAAAGVASVLTKDNGLTLLIAAVGAMGIVVARQLLRRDTRAIPLFLAALATTFGLTVASVAVSDGRTLRQFGAAVAFLALPLQAETWKAVPLMDGHCIEKMAKDPDAHPRSCAIQCAKGGYGVITAEGKFLRFDEQGNKKTLVALKKSEKTDHLRATVEGKLDGQVITVESIVLE